MNRGRGSEAGRVNTDVRSRGRQDYAVTSKRCSLVTVANPFKTGPWESKAFSNRQRMVSALCGVDGAKCSDTAHNSMQNSDQARFEFTQVMKASVMSYLEDTPDYYPPPSSYPQYKDQASSEDEVIVVPETFRHIFNGYDGNEFAGMAPPANRPVNLSGLLTVDCGATTTLTDSFTNMTDITPKVVTIQLAAAGATMKSSHVGTKTYYVYDRTGTLRPVHTKAYYVKELNQDLLAGRGLTNSDYRVILDKHESIAGIYPVGDDGTIDPANSFPFVSDYSEGLFYLRTEPIDATKYARLSGYNLWHRRFGHCPNENIRKTIPFSIGLDELHSHRFDPHEKCPACMMGKSHLNNKPGRKERSDKPLSRVYMDIFSSSVTSIEGHNYALVITDDCTGYRWLYGLKTKDDILRAVKKWYSGIAVLRTYFACSIEGQCW